MVRGAKTQVFAAADPKIEKENLKGLFFVPFCKEETPTKYARDEKLIQATWEWTVKILKEKLGDTFQVTV